MPTIGPFGVSFWWFNEDFVLKVAIEKCCLDIHLVALPAISSLKCKEYSVRCRLDDRGVGFIEIKAIYL